MTTVHKETTRWSRRTSILTVIALLTLCNVLTKCCFWNENRNAKNHDEHTIPTLLSVVDEKTGKYVYALENDLYKRLLNGTFIYDDDYDENVDIMESPTIHVEPLHIHPRDPLSVTWSNGHKTTSQGNAVVDDRDVVVLYCDDQILDPSSRMGTFLDAATIAQARATSRQHSSIAVDDTTWYFPTFPVVRHEECQFVLYKTLPGNNFALLASSEVFHIQHGNATPSAIHLALGDTVDEMVVQFKTGIEGKPLVKFGLDKESLKLSATGTSHTYTAQDMCQKPATEIEAGKFQPPGQLHVVRLSHLKPNTTYYYKVGVKDEVGGTPTTTKWSETYSFVSAPVVSANPDPFSYIVYGDQGCPALGWGKGGLWIAAMTTREVVDAKIPVRAVHHFGDLSYARGAAHIWDDWLNMISSFTTRVPLMISVGNHEYDHTAGGENGKDPSGVPTPDGYRPKWGNYDKDSGGECGVPTAQHFTMPNGTANSNGVFWYSYDFASVHTTVISSEHDLSSGSPQHEWLEQDLQSVDRSHTPWLVLELHRPMYESEAAMKNTLIGIEIRRRIDHLLKQYQVDLVLAGHYHSYQRSCKGLYKGKCNNGGPMHLTIGSAGANLENGYIIPGTKWTDKFIKGKFGYGKITVYNATSLHFEYIQAGGSDDPDAGKVLDEAWLTKENVVSTQLYGQGGALRTSQV